jgi:tRNA(Ile)-lysidine synthase
MLEQKVYQTIKAEDWSEETAFLLAVSTGVDSMVLLHTIEKLFHHQIRFGVAHVNHKLRKVSDHEADFLRNYCQEREIPYYERVWQDPPKKGIEAAAREFRYHFFSEIMTCHKYAVLLTAHHGDDQLETMLMKMIREGRLQNASGIKVKQPFRQGFLVRPLLGISKEEISTYARNNKVPYFEDESNQQELFQRNRLRHKVVPLLKEENSQTLAHFQNLSQEMIYARQLIEKQQEIWLKESLHENGTGYFLNLDELRSFSDAERYYFFEGMLQRVAHEQHLSINAKQQAQLLALLANNTSQWQIDLTKGWQIARVYQQLIVAESKKATDSGQEVAFVLRKGESLYLSDHEWIGYLPSDSQIPEKVMDWSEFSQILPVNYLTKVFLRKRLPGDRIRLKPNFTKKISRFFIDNKISNEKRLASWIVTDGKGEVLALLPYLFSYLSIAQETDKIHYILLYKYRE